MRIDQTGNNRRAGQTQPLCALGQVTGVADRGDLAFVKRNRVGIDERLAIPDRKLGENNRLGGIQHDFIQ